MRKGATLHLNLDRRGEEAEGNLCEGSFRRGGGLIWRIGGVPERGAEVRCPAFLSAREGGSGAGSGISAQRALGGVGGTAKGALGKTSQHCLERRGRAKR